MHKPKPTFAMKAAEKIFLELSPLIRKNNPCGGKCEECEWLEICHDAEQDVIERISGIICSEFYLPAENTTAAIRNAAEEITCILETDMRTNKPDYPFTEEGHTNRVKTIISIVSRHTDSVDAEEPKTSVIRWTRFVDAETAPHYGISILVIQKCSPKHVMFDGGMQHELDYGDLWAYLPEPPEGM